MHHGDGVTRRDFIRVAGAALSGAAAIRPTASPALAAPVSTPRAQIAALRRAILSSPVRVALHRAKVFTRVFQETEQKPWIVRKAMAL